MSVVGVAHWEQWTTSHETTVSGPATNWLVFCGQNGGSKQWLANGKVISKNGSPGRAPSGDLQINQGGCCGGERSDFGVAEVMAWDRALSPEEMDMASKYMLDLLREGSEKNHGPLKISPPPPPSLEAGRVAWFNAKTLDTSIRDGKGWVSSVANAAGKVLTATTKAADVVVRNGDGASAQVRYLNGDTQATVNFGSVFGSSSVVTLCSLTRYTGTTRGRILNAPHNWLHGHWHGRGVFY